MTGHRRPGGRRRFPAVRLLGVALLLLVLANPAIGQDLEPRRYVNVPVDQNFLRMAAGYSWGEVNINPGLPLDGGDLDLWGVSLAYLRTMDLGGKSASFDAYIPFVCSEGTTTIDSVRETGSVCGQGDARLRFTWNFIGAQAMRLDEFVQRTPEFVVGASVQVYLPIGAYDSDRLLNVGANRWVIRPEIGLSAPFGRWNLELSVGARFFQDNTEFLGDSTSSQDPLFNIQAHLVYDLTRQQWLSLNGNYFFGGETFRNGSPTLIQQENSRLGLTWHIARDAFNVFQLTLNTGIITRVGNDSNQVSIAWLRRWE